VPVVVRYEDVPAATTAASASSGRIRYASRAESRPGTQTPAATAGDSPNQQEGSPVDGLTDEQLTSLRQSLSLDADAELSAIWTALSERLSAPTTDAPSEGDTPAAPATVPATPALPDGTVAVDSATLEALQLAARRGQEAHARQQREDREAAVSAAVTDGRIPPARREHWLKQLEADPGAATTLASLSPGLIPVSEVGTGGTSTDADPLYAAVFGTEN